MMLRSVAAAVVSVMIVLGCDSPSDVLFDAPEQLPIDDGGRFRVTVNSGPDIVRGFTADGRVLYRSRGLDGFGDGWRLLSVPPEGGAVREEAGIYTDAFAGDSVSRLVFGESGRVLSAWGPSIPTVHGCGDTAPAGPTAASVSLFALGQTDGRPLTGIPQFGVIPRAIQGAATANQRVRITPSENEIRKFGVDPFGPAVLAGSEVIYSDGEVLFALDLEDPDALPDSLGLGAFPSVSPDGGFLVAALAVGLDSVTTISVIPAALGACTQQTVRISATGWELRVLDLATGDWSPLSDGVEPQFHPDGSRLLARHGGQLVWVTLSTGALEAVARTEGAFGGSVSPDGAWVGFSAVTAQGGADVFLVSAN